MERRSLEPGLMLFIKRKLENLVPLKEVKEMLLRAGFSEKQIDEAVREVNNRFPDTHQDIVAANSFLPPLKDKGPSVPLPPEPKKKIQDIKLDTKTVKAPAVSNSSGSSIFSGRLRRRDFIVGFIFFFGMGAVFVSIILGIFSFIFSDFTTFVDSVISNGLHGFWEFSVPLLISPITIMLFSMIFRRLHDLSLPGSLALGFLVFFVSPVNDVFSFYGILALQVVMGIVFLMLIAIKGDKGTNKYGEPEEIKGSTFARLFNSQ